MEQTYTRRFSLEEDFMNYKTNDLLYGFMRSLSTAAPTPGKKQPYDEYLTKQDFLKNKKVIASVLECSVKTIERHLIKLMEAGLVKEDTLAIEKADKTTGKTTTYNYEVYRFPYDYDSNYEIIPQKMARYLVDTRNSHAIRIYIYLLNKYKWKAQTQEQYKFTIRELKAALGYAETTKSIDVTIRNILESFAREGVISYRVIKEEVNIGGINEYKVIPVERMLLTYVVKSPDELRNCW